MIIDQFWEMIEACRAAHVGMTAFNREIDSRLAALEPAELASFNQILWSEIGVYNDHKLWGLVDPNNELISGEDSWEAYGGWLIAQGRDFYESVMRDPQEARRRLPTSEDLDQAESFIFAAGEAYWNRTGSSLS